MGIANHSVLACELIIHLSESQSAPFARNFSAVLVCIYLVALSRFNAYIKCELSLSIPKLTKVISPCQTFEQFLIDTLCDRRRPRVPTNLDQQLRLFARVVRRLIYPAIFIFSRVNHHDAGRLF